MAEATENSPKDARIIAIIKTDIERKGPIYQALVSALCKEIIRGGPLVWAMEGAFARSPGHSKIGVSR